MLLVFIVQGLLICSPKAAPVLVSHTEAKVLLLSQNGTVGSDWSASNAYPLLLFWRGDRWSGLIV